MGEEYNRLNLLELLLTSMKGGAKYPYELNYLAGTLANIIDPTKKRVIALDQDQLGTSMIADLKDLYSNINVGRSWRGITPVIAISNPDWGKLNQLVQENMTEELTKSYPLVGSTLGSMEYPFGGKDEIIIIGNYNLEDLMKTLRNSLYPQLKINYDIPNGFISRALHDISEDAVRDIGRYNESYGKNYYVARSVANQDKINTYFYYSKEVIPEEVVKREFSFQCISTDPQFGNAPFYVKSQLIQGTGTPKIINTNTNKIIGFSDNMDTRVMQKLFSGNDVTFNKMFSDAVNMAYKNGESSIVIDGDKLRLYSEMDGSVMVEDPAMGQVTQAAPNPNVPGDMQLQGAPMDPNAAQGQPMIDPNTGMQMIPAVDPNTGQPMIDPNTGQPMMQLIDPNTGQPAIDPQTGQPMMAQPPMDPNAAAAQGQPMIQGQPAGTPAIDPNTGQPLNIAPADPAAMQQQAQPYEFAAAGQQQFSKNTELMNKLFIEDDRNFNKIFSDAVDRAFTTGRAKMFSGGNDGRIFNLGRVINPRTGLPEVVVQDYSNKGLQLTRVFTDTKNNKMRLNSIDVNNNTNNMVRQFSDETEVMTRIFSQKDPQFNSDFSRAVLRAYNEGKSYMFSERSGKEIELTRVYGDVVAEDKETGELTAVTPDEEGDLNLVALDNYGQDDSEDGTYNDGDVPYDDIVDNLEDRDPMNPEFYNKIDTGIVDEDLAGLEGDPSESFDDDEDEYADDEDEVRDFSIDAALFGKNGLKMFADSFVTAEDDLKGEKNFNPEFTNDINVGISKAEGDGRDSRDGKVDSPSDTEPTEIGGAGNVGCGGCQDSRNYSGVDQELGIHMYSDEDVLTDIAEKANDIQSGVDELTETKDKELAEELQDKVDDLKKELEIFEGDDEVNTEDVKEQCKKYSKLFSKVANGHYDTLEYRTVNFSKTETPKFAPNSNLLSMLFSGTENEDLIDAAQAEDAGMAPEGDYEDIDSYQEQPMPEEAPALEPEPEVGGEEGGEVSVTIDGENNDITINKSFSEGTTRTFAANAYNTSNESNSLFSNCLTCDLN